MFMSQRVAWVVVVIVALVALGCNAAMAADPAVKIGVVDLVKVNSDAPRIQQYWEEFNKAKAALESKLDIRQKNMLLSENEVVELIDLKSKATRTDKEIARVKELEGMQESRNDKLTKLNQTTSLTDQEKIQLKELQDSRKKSEEAGMAFTKDYDGQLKDKLSELDKKAEADLKEAISKVAAAKGLTVVITKDAVLFGGEDVTGEVVKQLDRKPV